MDSAHIYQQIVDSIRDEILSGALKPGSVLPPMRKMTSKWNCTTGTIMRAYQELARMGLVVSHVGKGTKVVEQSPDQNQSPLRRAALFNRAESFLLETMTAGYSPDEIEKSMRVALDRWRATSTEPETTPLNILRFAGSHDPSLALIASMYHDANPQFSLHLTFNGSLGGLIALAERKADLAGCHLWDENTDTYNEPFIRKLLPGQKVAMLTLAHRHVGLILNTGISPSIKSIKDLARPNVQFANRQQGSGTRVWLDSQFHRLKISPAHIQGYSQEYMTHSEVARAISKGQANAGIGVETAALSFGLEFKPLTTERYDLIVPFDKWEARPMQALKKWLTTRQSKEAIESLGGYDTSKTGTVIWVS